MIDKKIKIMMLKGEKGDTYDDTELRAEISAELANTPYMGYTEDGTFELPLHSINDSVKGSGTTWSSNKIDEITANTIYTVEDTSATTATCSITYDEIVALITSNDFKPEVFITQGFSMATIRHHIIPDEYQAVSGSSNSYISVTGTYNGYSFTITHNMNNTISVAWVENEDYSSEIATLQSKQVDVVTVGAESEITLGTNGGFISLFKQVPTSASVPAGTIADAFIIGLPTNKYPPTSPLGNVYVFATKLSGSVPVYIDMANVTLHNDQYYVTLTLRNTSNETISYNGLTDVMLVNMN